ncbi:hypothetical protein IMCC9480_2548 [Oxalobacteraceae bacterium IMCC9480]|nr:hypothetical protein IMCC9480_2548 [Oxalobacteraceae bacterium IMCC9480]
MSDSKQPTKEQVREYMGRRQRARKPPPDPREVRRQLGWDLAEIQRKTPR